MTLGLSVEMAKIGLYTWRTEDVFRKFKRIVKENGDNLKNGAVTAGVVATLGSTITAAQTMVVDTAIVNEVHKEQSVPTHALNEIAQSAQLAKKLTDIASDIVILIPEIPVNEKQKIQQPSVIEEQRIQQPSVIEEQRIQQPSVTKEQEIQQPSVTKEQEIQQLPLFEAQVSEAGLKLSSMTEKGVTINYYPVTEEFLWQHAVKTGDYAYTEDDLRTLEKVIYVEARGEGLAGQVIVGNTVINRSKEWGCSIHEVANSKGQFASISNIKEGMITDEIRRAARMSFEYDITKGALEGGALYFYNPEGCKKETLQKLKKYEGVKYKNHIFYR